MEEEEEASSFELSRTEAERIVTYNPSIPIESFDLVSPTNARFYWEAHLSSTDARAT